jgi:hypothetical protein
MTRFSPANHGSDVLVTVIVPVFNTRPHLVERAVNSALKQTYSDLELLIVDDGSAAELAAFLDGVAKADPRIRVVHRANGGVSAARNTGLEHALGDFIVYLDSDDYLEPGFLSAALDVARTADADVVFGGMRVLHGVGSVEWRTGGPSAEEPLLGTPDTIVAACVRALSDSPSAGLPTQLLSVTNVVSCLYRSDVARRHGFPVGVSHAEDRLHNVRVLIDASRVAFCSDVWYVYDATHDQGATRRATPQTIIALSHTVREFAGIGGTLASGRGLSDSAHNGIAQAAANGVLNYLKLLSGVMAAVGRPGTNRAQLRQLLAEPSVFAAISRATQPGWQNTLFSAAARHRQINLLLVLGWFWVRTRRLQMSVERPKRTPRGRKNNND